MADTREPLSKRSAQPALWIAVVALALLAAYWPSLGGGFIWDDDAHVVDNPYLRDLAGLAQIWLPGHTPQFYPITFSVFWLEYQLWGANPLGYDLVNLALHGANALLVWRLFGLLGLRWAGVLAAAFALHPLHVESVAWAMELKNVLSGFFYLAAGICYVRFDDAREAALRAGAAPPPLLWRGYAAVLGLFALALLSKSVTATLPAALVLALLYRGGALSLRRLAPLAPMFAIGVGAALFTMLVERDFVGARGTEFAFSTAERLLIAARVLLFYPQQLLAPHPLLFCYPRFQIAGAEFAAFWPVAVALAIGALALLAYRKGWRGAPLALAFYAGSLFPALGLIDFYPMIYSFVADHFAYLPSLGVLAFVVGSGDYLLGNPGLKRALAAALLLALAGLTWHQSANFRDAQTLYRHSIAHNPDGYLCVALVGTELIKQAQLELEDGAPAAARAHFEEAKGFSSLALALKEDQQPTHFDLAIAHFALGEATAGLAHAERSAELAPNQAQAQWLAARALEATGRRAEAAARYRRVLALEPTRSDAALPLAWLLATSADEAVRSPQEALALARGIAPRGPNVVRAEAAALAALGRFEQARDLIEPLLASLRASGSPGFTSALARDLELYARGEALRE